MTDHQVRLLLDLAWDVGARADNEHVVRWARLHRQFPLDIGVLVRIAEKFGHILIIPKHLPLYAKEFLVFCKHEKDRLGKFAEAPRSLADVEMRLEVQKLRWLAGLDRREERYIDQLYGFGRFTQLIPVELAEHDKVTPPALTKRVSVIRRKLTVAAYLSQLEPVERQQVLTSQGSKILGLQSF